MQKRRKIDKKEKGQALVEFAFMFAFLLVLIIAFAEAGVLLNRQIVVVNAAREGARFGAYGADAEDIHAQTLLATSQMFEFTEDNAVIAVIVAETNKPGRGFRKWDVHGVDPPHVTKKALLATLQEGVPEDEWESMVGGLELVVVDVRYEHESAFGFPILAGLFSRVPVGSWTVMRAHG